MSLDPNKGAKKWSQRVSQSLQDYKDGISQVTEHPGVKAASQADVWAQNTLASKDKWKENVQAGSLEDWKRQAMDIGASKFANSGAKGQGKMEKFNRQFYTFLNSTTASLPPRGNKEQNQARYQAMQSKLNEFKYNRRGI